MKTLDTLISDVEKLIEGGHNCDPGNVAALGQAIAETIAKRLKEAGDPPRKFKLSMSQIGKPDRQLWYEAHHQGNPEKLDASARIKFLFGDILEHVLLFLATEAGHTVEAEQKSVEIDGVRGRMDAIIDGEVVDTKSASSFAFTKFKDGSLPYKDDFGYMWQLAGYCHAEDRVPGAFFVIDKQLGHICLMRCPRDQLSLYNVPERIAEIKAVLALPEPPAEKCFDAVPDGKSGNMKLTAGCGYCKHKEECWPGLRTFIYSTGPRFLTTVLKQPEVPEVNGPLQKEEEQE